MPLLTGCTCLIHVHAVLSNQLHVNSMCLCLNFTRNIKKYSSAVILFHKLVNYDRLGECSPEKDCL